MDIMSDISCPNIRFKCKKCWLEVNMFIFHINKWKLCYIITETNLGIHFLWTGYINIILKVGILIMLINWSHKMQFKFILRIGFAE